MEYCAVIDKLIYVPGNRDQWEKDKFTNNVGIIECQNFKKHENYSQLGTKHKYEREKYERIKKLCGTLNFGKKIGK